MLARKQTTNSIASVIFLYLYILQLFDYAFFVTSYTIPCFFTRVFYSLQIKLLVVAISYFRAVISVQLFPCSYFRAINLA